MGKMLLKKELLFINNFRKIEQVMKHLTNNFRVIESTNNIKYYERYYEKCYIKLYRHSCEVYSFKEKDFNSCIWDEGTLCYVMIKKGVKEEYKDTIKNILKKYCEDVTKTINYDDEYIVDEDGKYVIEDDEKVFFDYETDIEFIESCLIEDMRDLERIIKKAGY